MNPANAASREYDARIHRADELIAQKSPASEVLLFYKRISSFQKSLYWRIADAHRAHARQQQFGTLRNLLDLTLLLPHFRNFLALVREHAPNALAGAASQLEAEYPESWVVLLTEYWQTAGLPESRTDAFAQFFPRAFLEPYAVYLAGRTAEPPALETPRVCPLCGAQPMLGVLRPEGDGGKRWMVCSFCGHEWDFRRLLCPSCGEEEEKKLPVYIAEQFPHVRVECCETCRFYMRTIDLTKDGKAVPIVDDLAAISLTLWADEHGYRRMQPNLLGS
jgi:FdhE protein